MINGQKARSSVLLMATAFLAALLFSTGAAAQQGQANEGNGDTQAQESAQEGGDKLFLTALDMGALWFANQDLQAGFMVRTLAEAHGGKEGHGRTRERTSEESRALPRLRAL